MLLWFQEQCSLDVWVLDTPLIWYPSAWTQRTKTRITAAGEGSLCFFFLFSGPRLLKGANEHEKCTLCAIG